MAQNITRDKSRGKWVTISLFNFCVVALVGVILRSKILFSIPFLDYNRLLDAHFHFAFAGWVTLALASLFVYDILPPPLYSKPVYKWLLRGLLAGAWLLLLSSPLPANSPLASTFATIFILVTYVFGAIYINHIRTAAVSAAVRLLTVFALCCLILSSAGIFALAYLFATKSLNMFAYRDSLYTYLHLMYNGFFSLGAFAVLINRIERQMGIQEQKNMYRFVLWVCISVFPSVFLTYLWRDPNNFYRVMAVTGSITLLITAGTLLAAYGGIRRAVAGWAAPLRLILYLALAAFLLKTVLQCFTIFPAVGNAVFGDRPVIIGFLHLVFLGFVSLMLIVYFAESGLLGTGSLMKTALGIFTMAILLNETVLMAQGLAGMLVMSSRFFPWWLWGISILLFAGVGLVFAARLRAAKV